jgi:uncharacterized protein YndB with AHSA1/START domain
MKRLAFLVTALGLAAGPALAQSTLAPAAPKPPADANAANPERALSLKVKVPAPIEEVWKAWTSVEGIRTFFAPGAKIDYRTGGDYEIWFNPYAPAGMRGTDGMQILAMQEPRMLTFTWIAPPTMPAMRKQVTYVTIRLKAAGEKATEVSLLHGGWGEGPEWDAYFASSEKTWQSTLAVLARRFEKGPVDWTEIEARLKATAPVMAK